GFVASVEHTSKVIELKIQSKPQEADRANGAFVAGISRILLYQYAALPARWGLHQGGGGQGLDQVGKFGGEQDYKQGKVAAPFVDAIIQVALLFVGGAKACSGSGPQVGCVGLRDSQEPAVLAG